MDQELKQYLDANFARIDERFAEVDRRTEAMEARVEARIEKVETSLLGAFYGWARPMEIR
jgi:tetrahydromethanopterin S-methyltransferase subunit G